LVIHLTINKQLVLLGFIQFLFEVFVRFLSQSDGIPCLSRSQRDLLGLAGFVEPIEENQKVIFMLLARDSDRLTEILLEQTIL